MDELWPVLLLLLVVAVPTISVLWFVGVAVDNQQLASKQRLTEAYQSSLLSIRAQLATDWERLGQQAEQAAADAMLPREMFLSVLSQVSVDSVICLDESSAITYPDVHETLPDGTVNDPRWAKAIHIENQLGDPTSAQVIYEEIADAAVDPRSYALAIQGQVRCLLKTKQHAAAIKLAAEAIDTHWTSPVLDQVANHAIANIELMAIENAEPGPDFLRIWNRLHMRIFSDSQTTIPSSQRLFIMRRMTQIAPSPKDLGRLAAEDLASQYAQRTPSASLPPDSTLQLSHLPDVWQKPTPDRGILLLFKTDTVKSWVTDATQTIPLPPGVDVELLPPTTPPPANPTAIALLAGNGMPGWQLRLSHRDDASLSAGSQSTRIHIWTAALVVLFSSVLGIAIARALLQQLRVANLKNDLVGTVSHELKTPLASMRLLVETLLDEPELNEKTTRDYLQLIDKENVRLSRLIENFLTFSRMEQNRHAFQYQDVSLQSVIQEAIDTLGDRLREPTCKLTLDIDQNLPSVWGDRDGLVTVLLNLLDNAHKYSSQSEPTHCEISVSAKQHDDGVRITIADNGIGLSKAATKKVFQRFFQVDQSLVRKGQGCGLGLSIVDYIVRAHDGTVQVVSELGKGSQFQVDLPISSHPQPGASHANR